MRLAFVIACGSVSSALATQINVEVKTKYQSIEGFGGAVAYYQDWLTSHPNKDKVYDTMFTDLGLSILRLRNSFYSESADMSDDIEIATTAKVKMGGGLPKIMLSSWSPPAGLKSNGNINKGTLAQSDGRFVYDEFGQWWANSLQWYKKSGVDVEYISIQNEPDMDADYDSCRFDPDESAGLPSYGKALKATVAAFKDAGLADSPRVLGPETLGIGYGDVEKYTATMDMEDVWGLAHHIYHGGEETQPDTFNEVFGQLSAEYADKPRMMTEYYRGDWMQTAWIVHNALAVEGVSGYIFWDLMWDGGGHMIKLDNPWNTSSWTTPDGFTVDRTYFAFKQYARFVKPGWTRVQATSDDAAVRVTAFVGPANDLSIVVVNPGNATSVKLDVAHLSSEFSGSIYQTTGTLDCALVGSYASGAEVDIPSKSVTTISTLSVSAPTPTHGQEVVTV